jgi:hypothetical protein
MALSSKEDGTMRIEDERSSKKKKLASLLGTAMGEFSQIYIKWEAREHFYTDYDDRGFFGKEDPSAKWRCNGFLDMLWRLCRFEMLYFGTNKTIWDITIQPISIYISRRVSGIFDTPAINDPKLPANWKASGYFGFGKVALISPSSLVDKFMSEITNLSVVAALFLTITIPLLIDGDVIVLLDDNYKKFFFILLAGSSVIGQLSTAVIALSLVTNLNKCIGDESRVLFVLSIFNPRNGITGFMGVALYLGAIFSWGNSLTHSLTHLLLTYSLTLPLTLPLTYLLTYLLTPSYDYMVHPVLSILAIWH